jgi:murein tripeptide amidase MpaA
MRTSLPVLLASLAIVSPAFGQPAARLGDPEVTRFDGYSSVRVTVTTPRQMLAVTSLMDMLLSESSGVGTFDVLLAPGKLKALTDLGIQHAVLSPNIQDQIDAESRRIRTALLLNHAGQGQREGRAWFDDYKTLAEINAYADALAAAKPAIVTMQNVGASLQGRQLRAIRITAPGNPPGNPRPAVIYHGGQHAREWITPMTVVYIADQLINGYGVEPWITSMLNNVEVIIIPVMNPDGYEYTWTNNRMWRKNRRNNGGGTTGVDLNRNWGFGWGGEGASTDPGNDTYRGPSAFSEPETQVMRDFITANPQIRAHIDFHSYSQLILSPYGYTATLPPDAAKFNRINAVMETQIESLYGTQYVSGPTYTTIYPASGGSSDWTYGSRGILGWGWELRDTGENGFVLPPEQIIPTGQETILAVRALTEYIAYPVQFSFPRPLPTQVSVDGSSTVDVTIISREGTVQAGSPKLYARAGSTGSFSAFTLTSVGGDTFRATLPPGFCNDYIEYYFEAAGSSGGVGRSPANAPTEFYQALAFGVESIYANACESSAGWVVGAAGDNATAGVWGLMDPQATAAQPGDDHSPVGTQCWVTDGRAGSGVGTYDVDGGVTTLTSPTFSAVENLHDFIGADAVLSYARWYSNDQGSAPNADSMPILISNDNGATWTQLEDVSENAGSWVVKSFRVADYITPTSQMKLRFIARDLGSGSVVEAAIDDIALNIFGCPRRPADFNGDGFIDLEDFSAFVEAFEAGDDSADFDESGFVDTDDFDAFVEAFELG